MANKTFRLFYGEGDQRVYYSSNERRIDKTPQTLYWTAGNKTHAIRPDSTGAYRHYIYVHSEWETVSEGKTIEEYLSEYFEYVRKDVMVRWIAT